MTVYFPVKDCFVFGQDIKLIESANQNNSNIQKRMLKTNPTVQGMLRNPEVKSLAEVSCLNKLAAG
jgi:uncharacterized pyridoxamine 5'-phosphate oxidase family protein